MSLTLFGLLRELPHIPPATLREHLLLLQQALVQQAAVLEQEEQALEELAPDGTMRTRFPEFAESFQQVLGDIRTRRGHLAASWVDCAQALKLLAQAYEEDSAQRESELV